MEKSLRQVVTDQNVKLLKDALKVNHIHSFNASYTKRGLKRLTMTRYGFGLEKSILNTKVEMEELLYDFTRKCLRPTVIEEKLGALFEYVLAWVGNEQIRDGVVKVVESTHNDVWTITYDDCSVQSVGVPAEIEVVNTPLRASHASL